MGPAFEQPAAAAQAAAKAAADEVRIADLQQRLNQTDAELLAARAEAAAAHAEVRDSVMESCTDRYDTSASMLRAGIRMVLRVHRHVGAKRNT